MSQLQNKVMFLLIFIIFPIALVLDLKYKGLFYQLFLPRKVQSYMDNVLDDEQISE